MRQNVGKLADEWITSECEALSGGEAGLAQVLLFRRVLTSDLTVHGSPRDYRKIHFFTFSHQNLMCFFCFLRQQ